jgi:hypothetical protein
VTPARRTPSIQGQKLVREWYLVPVQSVLRHEQPARETLCDAGGAVRERGVRGLDQEGIDRFPSLRVVYASGQFTDQRRDVVESEFFAKPYRLNDILEACKR